MPGGVLSSEYFWIKASPVWQGKLVLLGKEVVYAMNVVKGSHQAEEAELDRMMAEHGSSLLRMCYLYLRDAALAEDAVQDTFLKAYQNLSHFRGESSERSWLIRIAINTCKDYLRTPWFRRVDGKVTLENLPEPVHESEPSDSTVVDEVMRLPAKYKDVVLLRYYQELKIREVSETLRIPMDTVKSRIKRANQMLHQKLERWYFDE